MNLKILILENVENNFILKKLISFIKFSLDSEINVHNFEKLCVLEKKNWAQLKQEE